MSHMLLRLSATLALALGITTGTASAQFFYPPVGVGVNPGGFYSGFNPYRGNFTQVTPFGVTQFGNTPFGGSYTIQKNVNPFTGTTNFNKTYFNPYTGTTGFKTGFYNPLFNTYGYQYRYFR